jgi:predicted dehydrogenase
MKIGVIGTGHLGKYHLDNWLKIKEASLVGFYDPSPEAQAAIMEKYKIKAFSSVEELLQNVEVVDIVAPTDHHFDLCKKAILAQKHVFVEKPMVAKLEEAKEIVKLVREANIKFQVGHVERFNPAFMQVQPFITNPMFIEVHRLAQFNPRGTEVSVIYDLMIHDLDIVLSLVNSPLKNVLANGIPVITDTPDIANVRLEFSNGCVANLTSSRISMKKMRKIRLFQKDAYIGIDFLNKQAEVIKQKADTDENVFSFPLQTPKGEKIIAISSPKVPETNAIETELRLFTESILQNKPVAVNEIDGYKSIEVAHLILEKMQNNSNNY